MHLHFTSKSLFHAGDHLFRASCRTGVVAAFSHIFLLSLLPPFLIVSAYGLAVAFLVLSCIFYTFGALLVLGYDSWRAYMSLKGESLPLECSACVRNFHDHEVFNRKTLTASAWDEAD